MKKTHSPMLIRLITSFKIGPCTSCAQNLVMPVNNDIPIATGIAERAEQQETDAYGMTIFPNPAGKEVTFHIQGFGDEGVELKLFDYSGRAIWLKRIEEGQHELKVDLSDAIFANGIYIVKISSRSDLLTKRFVISK